MIIIPNTVLNEQDRFFTVPVKVFEMDLSPYELAVLFYLIMRSDEETHTCWPGVKSIANACNMSVRKVRDILHSLEDKGVISIKAKYVPTHKNFNRQTSNVYMVNIYGTPPAQDASSPCTICPLPLHDMPPPPAQYAGEINRTIPTITIPTITIPTLTSAEDGVAIERDDFLKLKSDCFEVLKNERGLDEDTLDLIDRSLEHLWFKTRTEHEGKIYSQSDLRSLIMRNTTPDVLVNSVAFLSASRDTVRSPVAYLGKCILGGLVEHYAMPTSLDIGQSNTESDTQTSPEFYDGSSTFDVEDFFAAALRKSYGS